MKSNLPFKVLVVEDEQKVAAFILKGLEENGIEAEGANNGIIGLEKALTGEFDLVIMDVQLPGMNGFEVVKIVREKHPLLQILMLTALGTTDDKVTGFDSGADHYMVKPFEFRELLARIRSLQKRIQLSETPFTILKLADLEMHVDEKSVYRAGKRIDLSAKEFLLLEYLLRNKGKVLSRMDIAEKVWDIHFDTGTNTIDVYVNFLRKKIDKEFPKRLLHTVTGMGYVLREEEE